MEKNSKKTRSKTQIWRAGVRLLPAYEWRANIEDYGIYCHFYKIFKVCKEISL